MRGSVPPPELDERRFDDLIQDARKRATRYLPEADWTDFNPSDPASTLLDLFAWFTEQMLYRFNRVPELHQVKFAELLGMSRLPPRPAKVLLEFKPAHPENVVELDEVVRVAGPAADGQGQVFFETDESVELIPRPLAAVRVFNGERYLDHTRDHQAMGGSFAPLGTGVRGSSLFLGFGYEDEKKRQTQKPQVPGNRQFPRRIRFYVKLPAVTSTPRAAAPQYPALRSDAELAWSYWAGDAERWIDLKALDDETEGFVRDGAIEIEGPPWVGPNRIGLSKKAECDQDLFWLRCTIREGNYPGRRAPRISRIHHNTVRATQRVTIENEEVGFGTGQPDAEFNLRNFPVLPGTLRIESESGDGRRTWVEVDDLDGSDADDRVFACDPVQGKIAFGGRGHGQSPDENERLMASYQFGGGARGNVPAGTVTQLVTSHSGVAEVSNPDPASGGRDHETVPELIRRAPSEVRRRNRAVTAADFEDIVLRDVGGIAMARAIPAMHPSYPGISVPGSVTVVVVPEWDFTPAGEQARALTPPTPDLATQDAVLDLLRGHRLVTTELHVAAPTFLEVTVEGEVRVLPGFSVSRVQRDVEETVQRFLFPLQPSPTRGEQNWQFGAELRPQLLHARILEVAGVKDVCNFDAKVKDAAAAGASTLLWSTGEHAFTFVRAPEPEGTR